jgi:hypothetical protein
MTSENVTYKLEEKYTASEVVDRLDIPMDILIEGVWEFLKEDRRVELEMLLEDCDEDAEDEED